MALTVTAGDLEALRFCESDEARSIVQNIAVILTTAKGTAPGDREFGVDMSFLDLPLPVAFQSTSPARGTTCRSRRSSGKGRQEGACDPCRR